jgi:hypothetical protein
LAQGGQGVGRREGVLGIAELGYGHGR